MDFQALYGALGPAGVYVFLIIGFAILVKGADWLVDGASGFAKRFNVSDIMIGLTVVAFGTSMPELVVSTKAALSGSSDIAIGNVVGSNIFNIGLILGLAGLIYPLAVQRNTGLIEIPLSFLAAVVLLVLGYDQFWGSDKGEISRMDAVIFLLFFAGFMFYVFKNATADADNLEEAGIEPMPAGKAFTFIALGLIGLVLGGNFVVDNAKTLATQWGMSDRVIGLTIVGIGTSLPELATSVVAAMKKNSDIAVGNVVGSNIFNVFFILGVSSCIAPANYTEASNLDMYVLFGFTIALFGCLFIGQRAPGQSHSGSHAKFVIERWQSGVLLIASLVYLVYLIRS